MSQLSTMLETLIESSAIDMVFQPIFEIGGDVLRVHCVESLSRCPGSTNAGDPKVLFAYARRRGLEPSLDRVCTATALERLSTVPNPPFLAVNVHAATLSRDPDFVGFVGDSCSRADFPLDKLVLEIVEHAPAWNRGHFPVALETARQVGIRIALDDVGEGHSNFRMMLDTNPDYLKLDAYVVSGCADDAHRRALIAAMVALGDPFDANVVAEGIECQRDLDTVRDLGVTLAQGFVLARPMVASDLRALLAGSRS